MRLGILIFDDAERNEQAAEQAAQIVVDALRAHDIDVVVNAPEPDALTTPERPAATTDTEETPFAVVLATFASAQEAGERLGRADCDGVLFWLGEGAKPALVAPAALSLACPLLLCGAKENAAFYDAAGVLADRGVSFDRLVLPPESDGTHDPANAVEDWLRRNSKKVRQKGTEAAQKLFNKRLILNGASAAQIVDGAQWFHQFGVVVTSAETGVEAGENDLVVQNGNACAALTLFLLRGVCDDGADVRAMGVSEATAQPQNEEGDATFVCIYRRKGRFTCLLALASATQTSGGFADVLFTSVLHAAPGDVRTQMKAACAALDIDVVEWPNEKAAAVTDAPV